MKIMIKLAILIVFSAPTAVLAWESELPPADKTEAAAPTADTQTAADTETADALAAQDLFASPLINDTEIQLASHNLVDTHPVTKDDFPGSWCIPGTATRLKLGGYVKLDAIYDFNEIGNRFDFLTPTIPTTSDNGGRTTFHARQSRLFVDTRTPTSIGKLRTYIEVDFFGNANTLRLRHAYGETPHLLAGQTWTTFMDISANPFTLDFEGPPGMVFRRQAQLRFKLPLTKQLKMAFAVENPSSAVDFVGGGDNLDPSPDFISNVRYEGSRGHIQLAGIVRDIGFRAAAGPTAGVAQQETGYGFSLSGSIKTFGKDRFKYQYARGRGIGHYFEDLNSGGVNTDGGADASGNLVLLYADGLYFAYEHHWNPHLRSNFVYGDGSVENSVGQAGTSFQDSEYVAVNAIYSPISQMDVGAEYLYGTHVDAANNRGQANRLQLSCIYRF